MLKLYVISISATGDVHFKIIMYLPVTAELLVEVVCDQHKRYWDVHFKTPVFTYLPVTAELLVEVVCDQHKRY